MADLRSTVDRLVVQLGDPDPDARLFAAAKLEALGPDALPALEGYRDHPDAEVAGAVNAIIGKFAWVRDGAIVTGVDPGSAGDRIGLRVGDVILRIDRTDIAHEWEVDRARKADGNTFQVWRAGKISQTKAPPGWLGTIYAGWAIAKGGRDQAAGVALARQPAGHAEAYRLLRTAWRDGLDDPWTLGLIASLAERHLDHQTAVTAYAEMHKRLEGCWRTHASTDLYYYNLPFNGPHAAYLLARRRAGPVSSHLAHELFDFATRYGRNLPLARLTATEVGPDGGVGGGGQWDDHWRFYTMAGRMMVAAEQRRWDDALRDYDGNLFIAGTTQDLPREQAIRAAVAVGRTARASEIAVDTIRRYGQSSQAGGTVGHGLYALALAAAAGDERSATAVTAAFDRFDRDVLLNLLAGHEARELLRHPGVRATARGWLERMVRMDDPAAVRELMLALIAGSDDLTADRWEKARRRLGSGVDSPAFFEIDLTTRVRCGDYAGARELLEGSGRPAGDVKRLVMMIGQIEKSAADWAALRPAVTEVVQVRAAREAGVRWALRSDGRAFRIDAAGKASEFRGLPAPSQPLSVLGEYLIVTPQSTAMLLPGSRCTSSAAFSECYVLDEKAGRWVDAMRTALPVDLSDAHRNATVAMLRHLDERHPLPPLPGSPRRFHASPRGDYATLWAEGNLFLVRDTRGEGGPVRDLSAEIGKAAGREKAAAVYLVGAAEQGKLWLTSDAGLWRFDLASAKVERVALGLKDEDVPVSVLAEPQWVAAAGKRLIGVAPQDGGQVVEVDVATGAARATGGFCGLGPEDWFAVHRGEPPLECWQAVDRVYRARAAK